MAKKVVSVFLIACLVSGVALCYFGTVNAESAMPKPSVPEFTAKLISSPPESQSVNRTIELSIKNQALVSFYNVRMRVNKDDWSYLYPNNNSVPTQSNGEYTILSYPSGFFDVEYQYSLGYLAQNLSAGDKVDFQVQAMSGSIHRVYNPNHTSQLDMYPYVFTGETSDWSNTQTITIPDGATSEDQTATPDQSSPQTIAFLGLDWMQLATLVLLGVIAVLLVVVVGFCVREASGKDTGIFAA